MNSWYSGAFSDLIDELVSKKVQRIDGAKFIRRYIDEHSSVTGFDYEDIETKVISEIDLFEAWLEKEHGATIKIGRNYFWMLLKEDEITKTDQRKKRTKKLSIVEEKKWLTFKPRDMTEEQANRLYDLALCLSKLSRQKESFKFAKKYHDYLDVNHASDSEKLKALDAIIRASSEELGVIRADTYKYHCKKAEIFTSKYLHEESAVHYKFAITLLENEQVAIKAFRLNFFRKNETSSSKPRIENLDEITKSLYQKCRIQYQNAGMSDNASDIYVKENKFVQKKLKFGRKKMFMWLLWLLARYGESPRRVAGWGVFVIFICSFIYMFTGVNSPSGLASLECIGSVSRFNCTELLEKTQNSPSYWSHLYYSVVTFTTLGYGDFSPTEGVSRFVSASQALLGLLLTSLFLGTFIKKYSR